MSNIDEESLKQRQDDEFLSIAAIFPNEVKDLRAKQAWKTWKPIELIITLSPDSNSTATSTEVDLYVKCSDKYPNAIPFIDIKNSKGLSLQVIAELKNELREVAKQNLGEEMLLDIIQYTRTFLSEHEKPHYTSFHEEMVHNHLQQQKEMAERLRREKEAQKLVEEKKLQAFEEAKNRKLEALRNANKRRLRESSSSSEVGKPSSGPVEGGHVSHSNSNPNLARSRSHSDSSCKEECVDTIRTTLKVNGKKELSVFCGQCVNHSERGSVMYNGMDTLSGEPVAIFRWTLHWTISSKPKSGEMERIKREQEICMKQLHSIEQEFKTLRQLKHDNVVPYLGFTYTQKKDKISIFLLQEYVSGCSLAHISRGIPLSVQQLQYYARGMLLSLQYLHENSTVHKSLRMSSIFLSSDGQIKISDFSLDKRMYDLYRMHTNDPEIDMYPPTIGKGGKKGDIYRFGILLLLLSCGHLEKDDVPKIPQSLNLSLRDFLSKCLMHDEHKRWSADQLLSHSFLAFSSLNSSLVKNCGIKNAENDKEELSELSLINDENAAGSRLVNEFEVLKCLGKGGFGHVLKVKNKLDARVYALKRIPLDPTNKQLDRKIKREVKLLSRLNHENIVRYYNSWIEETSKKEVSTSDKSKTSCSDDTLSCSTHKDNEKSAANSSIQWNMLDNKEDGFTTDEEDCEDYDTSLMFRQEGDSSSYIIFEENEHMGTKPTDNDNCPSPSSSEDNSSKMMVPVKAKVQRFMYIQMEFCEKSTLRTAIDNHVYKDITLVWRLFREIIEGLHHIHQQGVIHRDLKPVNIFLDSQDHVKIGDFGLATDVISKPVVVFDINMSGDAFPADQLYQSMSDVAEDVFRTGHVGTALYVAPEIASVSLKLSYSQKVDIYSLGIIFFEMCYPPPVTAMERVKLIMSLRQPEIVLPPDIEEHLSHEMMHILQWLLQHDSSKRPTSAELIASDYLPPLMMEETELHNALRNTILNPQSRTYKYMINCLFNQEVDAEFDFTYDMDISKGSAIKNKPTQVFSKVVSTLNRVVQRHGAINYSVPTLMPKSSLCDNDTCVYVLDHGGGVINLPHDLRVPFARHVAHKEITQLKRFALEKVYREQKVFGCHPREQYEYAFDIITPTPCSLMPDAEVISAIYEIILELPSLQSRSYFICLNHMAIFKAIFLYSGIDETMEFQVYDILAKQRNRTISKLQLQHQLFDLEFPEKAVMKLTQFAEMIDSIDKASSILQPMLHARGETSTLAKKGLKELKAIVNLLGAFGVKLPLFICPCLAHDIKLFSGVTFQFACHLKMSKKKAAMEILAAGGRYDKLVSSFKFKSGIEFSRGVNQSAVGVSVAVERIVAAEIAYDDEEDESAGIVDFLVYSDLDMPEEKSKLLRELWSMGLNASTCYDKHLSLGEAVHYCHNSNVSHLLILLKNEPGIVKVRFLEKDKVNEKKMCYTELREYLTKYGSSSKPLVENQFPVKPEYQRNHSLSNSSSFPSASVRFLLQDKNHSNRKREPNIRSHVMSNLNPLTSCTWEIIAVDLRMAVIGSIASLIEVNSNAEAINQSFLRISELHSKYKKYLLQLAEEICDMKSKKSNSAIILYSLPDNNFRVLI